MDRRKCAKRNPYHSVTNPLFSGQCALRLSHGQKWTQFKERPSDNRPLEGDSTRTTTQRGVESSCLNPILVDAVMFLLKTDRLFSSNNVHLVFQHRTGMG